MLSAYNLFAKNAEDNHRASSAWGRLRDGEHSTSVLCIKQTDKNGLCNEIVKNWGNCAVTHREEVPLTPPKLGTKTVYSAITPEGGTKVISTGRTYHLTVTNADQETTEGELHMLSPEKQEISDHIFAPPKTKKKRTKKSKPVKRTLIFDTEKENVLQKTQQASEDGHVVKPNKKPRKKDRSQVSVMGASPNEEWKEFQELLAQAKTLPAILKKHPELKDLLKRMQDDPKFIELVQNYHNGVPFGFEWTHEYARSLAGAKTFDAQAQTNMALAAKWVNSYMMTLEKLAFATSSDDEAQVTVKSDLERISGTRIVDKVNYDVHAVSLKDDSSVDIRYTLNALEPPSQSNCASKTDAIHLKEVSQYLLTNAKPTNEKVFATSNSTPNEKPLSKRLRSSNKRRRNSP